MFAIGSAEPRPALVAFMARLGAVLKAGAGSVVIRGHTDARPFPVSGGGNGNWRLSAERAQMAYFMLLRGGLPEARFLRLEGHASRNLAAGEPLAGANRRIEILLGGDG
jgi:chemotaxis protein MotB